MPKNVQKPQRRTVIKPVQESEESPITAAPAPPKPKVTIDKQKLVIYDAILHPKFDE